MVKTYHVKTGDSVVINAGDYKNVNGKIVAIVRKTDRAVVEVDTASFSAEQQERFSKRGARTVKKSQANPEGGMIARPVSVHVSNVNKLDK